MEKIYYGHYNENGEYIGFYTEEIHGNNIPTPNIQITEQQRNQALESRCKVINGAHTHVPVTDEEILEQKYNLLRSTRDSLLSQSDWTQMPDSPLTDDQKQAWATYRQSLRDLPDTVDINNIVYPETP